MAEESKRTWPLAARDAREAALDAIMRGEDMDDFDLAHEYAANDSDVFVYWHALCIYMDSSNVRDYASEVGEMLAPGDNTPEEIASACVYMALRDEYMETLEGLREDATHSGSVLANAARMRMRVEGGNARVQLHDMTRKAVAS